MKKKIVTIIAICLVFALCFIAMYDIGKKKNNLKSVKVADATLTSRTYKKNLKLDNTIIRPVI